MNLPSICLKQNGSHSKKVFKVSERSIPQNKLDHVFPRSHHFKPITTRVYHPGMHFRLCHISMALNLPDCPFELDVYVSYRSSLSTMLSNSLTLSYTHHGNNSHVLRLRQVIHALHCFAVHTNEVFNRGIIDSNADTLSVVSRASGPEALKKQRSLNFKSDLYINAALSRLSVRQSAHFGYSWPNHAVLAR